MNEYIEKALESWYKEDNPLRLEPLHPLLGLAGEAGELLNLYKKNQYKPEFSWLNCKHCSKQRDDHAYGECVTGNLLKDLAYITEYTPLIYDELGDCDYYMRILAWQTDTTLELLDLKDNPKDIVMYLVQFNYNCAKVLTFYEEDQTVYTEYLKVCFRWFQEILVYLDVTLDYIRELNYKKLNSNSDQHGWASAR